LLSFSTNLTNELRDKHSSAYWYIKLYYGDESSFTGLSDQDRVLSGVKYRGLILDWGGLVHSVDLPSFTASTLAMNGVTISNADDEVSGGRFSDLFNTQNYVNRKFTLHMGAVGVGVADHAQIAQGIITDQMDQSFDSLTLSLTEDLSSVSVEVPSSRVDAATYANAPENNWGKPIPMAWGDCGLKTDIGTIPTSGAEFDRHFVKGYFPAIITDRWNASGAYVDARPDQPGATFSDLSTKRVYYHGEDTYSPCDASNVNETEATPLLTFKGGVWRAYFPLSAWNTFNSGDYANMIDGVFSTDYNLLVGAANTAVTGFRVPKIKKLGEISAFSIVFDFGTFGGSTPTAGSVYPYSFQVQMANFYQITWNGGDQTIDVTAEYTAAKKDAWDFEETVNVVISDLGGAGAQDSNVDINQVGIEIEFTPSQNFSKEYTVSRDVAYLEPGAYSQDTTIRTVTGTNRIITPEVSDYIYYSGKCREYGAWVDADSRDNGYDSGDLIENPIYIIEDILRTELGLGSSEIDYATFDAVGNTTDGTIGNTFNMSVSAIEFAFSQYQFIAAWSLCKEIASSCGCVLFLSGDGTIKIISRERDEDYTSADKIISYNELSNVSPGITPLADVRNKVSVRYNMDYATDVLLATTAEVEDSTSQGSGANGINSTQELIQDNRFTLDSGTAVGASTALLDWLAYRKKILMFDVITPKHNDLEIGDTINFSNWPSTFKIYGNTITATDIYMITKITKKPNSCSISCQEVSEVGD
jgi:hypothetical protein